MLTRQEIENILTQALLEAYYDGTDSCSDGFYEPNYNYETDTARPKAVELTKIILGEDKTK